MAVEWSAPVNTTKEILAVDLVSGHLSRSATEMLGVLDNVDLVSGHL